MTLPWYPRDMGKYARKTGTLSLVQHGAYNLLLDHYYSSGPINAFEQCSSNASLMPDHSGIYRLCKATTKAEQEAVDFIIKKYFYLDDKGFYRNKEADEVIEIQMKKHDNRVRAGKSKAMLKQCSSNTPQKKTKKKIYSPLPPEGEEPAARVSVSRKRGGEIPFNIETWLTEPARDEARANAPQWDLHTLIIDYNELINEGKMEMPKKPSSAFPKWVLSRTKGKPPPGVAD